MKYDEAIQACNELLVFRSKAKDGEDVSHLLEERCVRAIVGGIITSWENANASGDAGAIDSANRSVARLDGLLSKVSSTLKSESWIWESCAFYHEKLGKSSQVLDDLLKMNRCLQAVDGWELDSVRLEKVCEVAIQISEIYLKAGDKGNRTKCKYMLNSLVKKIRAAWFDASQLPDFFGELESTLLRAQAIDESKPGESQGE